MKNFVTILLVLVSINFATCFFRLRKGVKNVLSGDFDEDGCPINDSEEVYRVSPKLIRKYGYPVECHFATTEDGYILGMHRIPHGKNKQADPNQKPLLLQHGFFESSAVWLFAGPEISPAFLLADQGYDVWLGNIRGNTYSRNHVSLSTSELKFWDFTYHENGIYDTPAQIDYILNQTNQTQVKYIGHSMGNTMFYVMGAQRPEYSQKVAGQIGLAPLVYLQTSTSPFVLLTPFAKVIETAVDLLNHGELLSRGSLLDDSLLALCTPTEVGQDLCKNIFFLLFGQDEEQIPEGIIPSFLADYPAGISIKTLTHLLQAVRTGKFAQYDYGTVKNLLRYNSASPPEYDMSSLTTPVATIYGENDKITSESDSALFYPQIPNQAGLFTPNNTAFTHLDFVWAKDLKTLVIDDVIEILNSFDSENQTPNVKSLIPVNVSSISSSSANDPGLPIGNELVKQLTGYFDKVKNLKDQIV